MKTEDIEREAKRLFRIVHGKGDAGSEFEFNCLNNAVQEGWLRLARETLKLQITKAVFTPLKRK